jgi:hypothetical protein
MLVWHIAVSALLPATLLATSSANVEASDGLSHLCEAFTESSLLCWDPISATEFEYLLVDSSVLTNFSHAAHLYLTGAYGTSDLNELSKQYSLHKRPIWKTCRYFNNGAVARTVCRVLRTVDYGIQRFVDLSLVDIGEEWYQKLSNQLSRISSESSGTSVCHAYDNDKLCRLWSSYDGSKKSKNALDIGGFQAACFNGGYQVHEVTISGTGDRSDYVCLQP